MSGVENRGPAFNHESISEMIKKCDNLNLFWNERRLMVLALIRTDFNIPAAIELNAPGMLVDTYLTKLRRYHVNLKKLKLEYYILKANGK